MYTSKTSAKVTFAITVFFCILLAALMIFASPILNWFFGEKREETVKTVLITFYVCCPAAVVALVSILRLMRNIVREQVFTEKNVFCMNKKTKK